MYYHIRLIIYAIPLTFGILFCNEILDMDKINQRYYTSILDSSFVGKSEDETIQIFNEYADRLTTPEYLTLMYEVAEIGDIGSAVATLIRQLNKRYKDGFLDPLILLELIKNESLNFDFRYVLLDFLGEINEDELTIADQIAKTLLSIAVNTNEVERIRTSAISVLHTTKLSKIIQSDLKNQELLLNLATHSNTPALISSRATKLLDSVSPINWIHIQSQC